MAPNTACAVGAVAAHEALVDLHAQHLIAEHVKVREDADRIQAVYLAIGSHQHEGRQEGAGPVVGAESAKFWP